MPDTLQANTNTGQLQLPHIDSTVSQGSDPSDLHALIQNISADVNTPLPPMYTQGLDVAQPHLRTIQPYQPRSTNNQPMNNQATSIKDARRKNSFAELANTIGQAGQKIQQAKQDDLRNKLSDVMKYKTNVANAQAVLQQDPNNELAKQVLGKNKQALDAILSDPKHQKQLAKALDISFTDMEKNKTPEVKAYMDATKEFNQAGPFKYDNPQEAKVAQMASGDQGKALKSGILPEQQQVQQEAAKSNTPYADKALAKDVPNMQVNPQYDAALKRREAAQKQITQFVIPKMIQANIDAAKQGDMNQRANLQAAVVLQKEYMAATANKDIANTRAQAELDKQRSANAALLTRARLVADTAKQIAQMKDKTEQQKLSLIQGSAKTVDDSLVKLTTQNNGITSQINKLSLTKEDREANADTIASLNQALDNNNKAIATLQTQRNNILGIKDSDTSDVLLDSIMGNSDESNRTAPPTSDDLRISGATESDIKAIGGEDDNTGDSNAADTNPNEY